jgi:hypothetical protein
MLTCPLSPGEEESVMLSQFSQFVGKFATMVFNTWPTLGGASVYRPEKYYMRGPGPQWHAKHDRMH